MATALAVIDTVVIAALVVLVAGLLRAHGETTVALEALNRTARRPEPRLAEGVPTPPQREQAPDAADLRGPLVGGGYADIAFATGGVNTVLAFLSSGCATCHEFWAAFQKGVRDPLPGDAQLVIVTNDSSRESPSKLKRLAPEDVPVVMSTDAWEAYDVPASPYFVYIDGTTGRVHGEGSALQWPQVASLLNDALFDAEEARREQEAYAAAGGDGAAVQSPVVSVIAAAASASTSARTGAPAAPVALGESNLQRNLRADAALRAAGIPPDDPSFWDLPRQQDGA